jgi:hypothetical protein
MLQNTATTTKEASVLGGRFRLHLRLDAMRIKLTAGCQPSLTRRSFTGT